MSWEHRWAWFTRHVGDRADTGYLRFDRRRLRVLGARASVVACGLVVAALVAPSDELVAALCAIWGCLLAPLAHRRLAAGLAGERIAERALMRLPRGNIILNNLLVPWQSSPTGTLELDFVVVTQRGYVVVEVKHQRGEVSGDVAAASWRVHKPGPRGGRSLDIANPVLQVKRQIYALSQVTNESANWRITGVVVFTHPSARVDVSGQTDVRVVSVDDLRRVFPSRDPTGSGRRVAALLALRRRMRRADSGLGRAPPAK